MPPYCGLSGDVIGCSCPVVGGVEVVGVVGVVEVVGMVGVVGVACPHDAITRDSTIKQLITNHKIFFASISSPPCQSNSRIQSSVGTNSFTFSFILSVTTLYLSQKSAFFTGRPRRKTCRIYCLLQGSAQEPRQYCRAGKENPQYSGSRSEASTLKLIYFPSTS